MAPRRAGPLDDGVLIARLQGTSLRLAGEEGSIAEAAAELRRLAGGRTDLLAQAAGTAAGAWTVRPVAHHAYPIAVGLLVAAGLGDHLSTLEHWITVGRASASEPLHHDPHP